MIRPSLRWLLVLVAACGAPKPVTQPPPPPPSSSQAPPPEPGPGARRVEVRVPFSLVILGLEPHDAAAAHLAQSMTAALRAAAREYDAITMRAAQHDLMDEKLLNDCPGEPACMARIGQGLHVDQLVYGIVAQRGTAFFVSLTLLDVGSQIAIEWTGTVQDAAPELQVAARNAIATLVDRVH